jgi:hypothetical protein
VSSGAEEEEALHVSGGGRLLLIEEEWSMRMKATEKASASGKGVSNGMDGRGRGGGAPDSYPSNSGGGGMARVTTMADRATGHANVVPRRRLRPIRPKMMSRHCCW